MALWKQFLVLVVIAVLGVGGYAAFHTLAPPGGSTGPPRPKARAVPVEVAAVQRKVLYRTVEAVGTTRARRSVEIVPLAAGRVVAINIHPGASVKAGDVLVHLDDDIERANLAEAQAKLVEQRQAWDRAKRLRRSNTVSVATLEQAKAQIAIAEAAVERARRHLNDREIRAPFDGVVGLTNVDLGARVDDKTVLTTLDDLSEVEVEFSLPETLFADIAIGQTITAHSAAFGDRIFQGHVAAIDSRIDPVSRAFKVRAAIPNPEGILPAGMFMSLTLTLSQTNALVVPEDAIVLQAADTFVYVVKDGRAMRRAVKTGQRREGLVAITSGLKQGEQVVFRGLQRLRDGSQVRVLGANAPPATAASGTRSGS